MLGSRRDRFAWTLDVLESVRLNKTVVPESDPGIRHGEFVASAKPISLQIAFSSASKVHHVGGVKARLLREYMFDPHGFPYSVQACATNRKLACAGARRETK